MAGYLQKRNSNILKLKTCGFFLQIIASLLLAFPGGKGAVPAFASGQENTTGTGELQRLIADHIPKKLSADFSSLKSFEREVDLGPDTGPVIFSIPGFDGLGCRNCHRGKDLIDRASARMKKTLADLKSAIPEITKVPLRQYIIQSWTDELLAPGQFAHTTFDTIRIFPRTIIIDDRVYGNATHLHESLHLTQSFVGHANELEAYGLNIRADPRFLLLNFPYFSDVVTAFFQPDFPEILKRFLGRPVQENLDVSREVQWFINPFDEKALNDLSRTVENMKPLQEEAGRLNREHPVWSAFTSQQTGNPSILLEIAAVKLLPVPASESPADLKEQARVILNKQMKKTDNIRLGYRVNRKQEALLHFKYQLKVEDPTQRLNLYFSYLKDRYIDSGGNIRLVVDHPDDLKTYLAEQLRNIQKLARFEHLTPLEKDSAHRLIETIKKQLSR